MTLPPAAVSWIGAVLLALSAFAARAHDPGLSSIQFQITPGGITATATLARADVEVLGGVKRLGDVIPESLFVVVGTNRFPASLVTVALNESDAVCQLSFPTPVWTNFVIESELLNLLPRGHRQFVAVRDSTGNSLGEKLFDAHQHTLAVTPGSAGSGPKGSSSFAQFLLLGIEHIATGFDHLVFLFGLLLVSRTFRDVLKVITAFTVAHSITLALATLELIRVSPRIVEPLIAASIIYVGIENLLQRGFQRRWMLAFAFGLIHGCGFASALKESGVGRDGSGIALPLLSFNLGVESGQLALSAIVLPFLWQIRKHEKVASRFVTVCSALIVVAGMVWLINRIFSNPAGSG
ncbi:MAG: hypothetical protein QOF48_2331 [Verrucomicrobiota bacterium]|jgi:hydrogenase/urease accessory protein HupE